MQTSELASHGQAKAFDVKVSNFAVKRSVLMQEDPRQATKVIAGYSRSVKHKNYFETFISI